MCELEEALIEADISFGHIDGFHKVLAETIVFGCGGLTGRHRARRILCTHVDGVFLFREAPQHLNEIVG